MAKHYLDPKQSAYVVFRISGMYQADAWIKAYGETTRKLAAKYGSRLEEHKLVGPAIMKELQKKKGLLVARQEEIMERDLSRIHDVADLGQVKNTIEDRIHEMAEQPSRTKSNPTYDTSLDQEGMPPAHCSGRTYKGHIFRVERPVKKRRREFPW